MSISDARAVEGDSGTRQLSFKISTTGPVCGSVSVDFSTHDGSATAGEDYASAAGSVVLRPSAPALLAAWPHEVQGVMDIAVAPNGDLYMTDTHLNRGTLEAGSVS